MEIRLLDTTGLHFLNCVAEELFDRPIHPSCAAEFLSDPRHHLAVAIVEGTVVGFASGVRYLHPDQPAALWVHEVSVAAAYRRRGAGRALLEVMFAHARSLGCRGAWVGAAIDNDAGHALYTAAGGRRAEPDFVMYEWAFESSPRCGDE